MRAWYPASVEVVLEPVPQGQVLEGAPQAGFHELDEAGEASLGVWELSVGCVTDIEVAEYSVVVSGLGELVVNDEPPILLREGVAFRLDAGDRTIWRIDRPLRKIYVLLPTGAEQAS